MEELKNQQEVKELILEFFKGSKINQKDEVITISDVPPMFEEIFGKKSPYKLVFDVNKHDEVEGSELILQGSYFLSTIKECMKDKGQTSLSKLDLKLPQLEINNKISFQDHNVVDSRNKKSYTFLPEFMFFSNCQSLNEKNQFSKKILVKNNKVVALDVLSLKFLNPNINELLDLDINKDYEVAKEDFKNFISIQTKEIKQNLKKKLKIQLERINEYYHHQIKEKDDEIQRCRDKIVAFQRELKHTFYERDANNLRRNMRDTTARLELLRKQGYKQRLELEKSFHIKDETDKHVLTIENSLVNLNVLYYPISIFSLVLEKNKKKDNKPIKQEIQIGYDPLFKSFSIDKIFCPFCNKNADIKINLISKEESLVCNGCFNNIGTSKKTKN